MQNKIDAINVSLSAIAAACTHLVQIIKDVDADESSRKTEAIAETSPPDEPEKQTPPAKKKVASRKKVASKKKADVDYSDMVVFKKALFNAAEASGADDIMPNLKKFIISQGVKVSDEIPEEERADVVDNCAEFFKNLAAKQADVSSDDDDDESLDDI